MNNELLQQFYARYRKELYLYLYSLSHIPELADDLLQETFLKAIISLPDNHTNIRAWLYMVARNLYYNHRKKEKSKVFMEDLSEHLFTIEDNSLETLLHNEKKQLLYQVLNQLDVTKREVLILQYFGNFSQKEIAAMLHISPENVRVQGYRGKKELKNILEVQGYEI